MNSINDKISIFESLPELVIGTILDQLNKITGSKGFINEADIPVIKRYANSLVCTSKTMAAKATHPEATYLFLESLSAKYGKPPEEFAAILNTVGCRRWLWNYIKVIGDDKNYQVIQDIYELASDVLKEAKNAGIHFDYSEGRKGWPSPNPFYYQTKQGFVLKLDWAPNAISTPFGEIKIYGGGSSSCFAPLSVAEIFIKRLNGVFEYLSLPRDSYRYQGEMYEIHSSETDTIRKIDKNEIKKLNEDQLANKKGTQNLIVNTMCGNLASYNIREVKGKKVPDVIWHDSEKSKRSYELINRIWKMLEDNREGKDPIAIKIKDKEVIKPSKKRERTLFKNISEVSTWAIELVEKLERQPIFKGETWLDVPTKLLVFEDGNEQLVERLNFAAKEFLGKNNGWHINTFGYGNNNRSLNGKNLGLGIELWIYEGFESCDVNTLKGAYDLVLKSIGQNWVRSELKDYPAILHTQSEEDYILFVKKDNLVPMEDMLMSCLANPLGLTKSIHCYSDWIGKASSSIYLWIKKDCLDKALAALNIIQ